MDGRLVKVMGALLCAACGSAPAPRSQAEASERAPEVTAEQLTAAPGHVGIGALTLSQAGKPGLVMRADGTVVTPDNRVLGKLAPDGRFSGPNGALLARLTEAGEVVVGEDEYLPVVIGNDGSLKLLKDNRTLRLRDDGSLEGVVNPNAPAITIEGLSPRTRRAAMFLLVLSAYPVRSRS